jgi:hypothetical protein
MSNNLQILWRKEDKPNEPDPCRTSANTDTEAVPNEMPNDCNMAIEEVPDEIPNDCNMTTGGTELPTEWHHERVKITTMG